MNTLEICSIVEKIPQIVNFEGALPIDRIIASLRAPRNMIVNLDESHEEGSHWTAVHVDNKKKASYFDSFAGNIPREIGEKLNICEKSSQPVQSLFSNSCGFYCILFLYLKSCHYNMNFIQSYMKKLTDVDLQKLVLSLQQINR